MALRLCQIQYGTTSTGQILFSISPRQEVSVKSKKGIFGKIGMSGIQIQVHQMIVVLHHGEPCTYRWTKNIIFGNKKKIMECTRFSTL